jgi:hypothetical protein
VVVYDTSTQVFGRWEMAVQGKKLARLPSKPTSCCDTMYNPTLLAGLQSKIGPRHKHEILFKKQQNLKRAGCEVVQEIELLLSKNLNSNLSITKELQAPCVFFIPLKT